MYTETPLIKSEYFDQDVYLKLENTQPSGSFKSRGLTYLISETAKQMDDQKTVAVFSSSGGNAGLAAAEAAHRLSFPCTVVVPETTKPRMRVRIGKYGAHVIVKGKIFKEADEYLRQLIRACNESGEVAPIYCHAFDNELIWEGHSTIVDEICDQFRGYNPSTVPKAIVLSCGGGGLYIGVMRGLERLNLADKVRVFVVETRGSASFHDSVKAGKQVFLTDIHTIATSLGSVYVPQVAVDYSLKYNSQPILVSDDEAMSAVEEFANDHCMIVEPACAATLAAIRGGYVNVDGPIVAIVCGGTSFSLDDIKRTK